MAYGDKAKRAIQTFKNGLVKDGTDIVLIKLAVVDENGFNPDEGTAPILEPEARTTIRAFTFSNATDETLSKLTSDELSSYSMALKLYTTEPLDKVKYKIEYRGKLSEIFFVNEKILQDTTIMFEVLLKR